MRLFQIRLCISLIEIMPLLSARIFRGNIGYKSTKYRYFLVSKAKPLLNHIAIMV